MKILTLLAFGCALAAAPVAVGKSPEQQTREFAMQLVAQSGDAAGMIDALLKTSPRYASDATLAEQTKRALITALGEKQPLSRSHFVARIELAATVVKNVASLESAKGPLFLKMVFYRPERTSEDWQLVSIATAADPEVFLR